MSRALYIVAFGLTLAGCSGSTPNWSFLGLGGSAPPPEPAALRVESDPPGAEAKSSLGPTCLTPCALPVEGGGSFAVTMTLNGYLPQTVPVAVGADGGGGRFTPNPVFAKLEPTAPPKKKKPKRVAAKPKPVVEAEAAPATASASPWQPPR